MNTSAARARICTRTGAFAAVRRLNAVLESAHYEQSLIDRSQLMTLAPPLRPLRKMVNYVVLAMTFFSHREQRACFEGNKRMRNLNRDFQKSLRAMGSNGDLARRS